MRKLKDPNDDQFYNSLHFGYMRNKVRFNLIWRKWITMTNHVYPSLCSKILTQYNSSLRLVNISGRLLIDDGFFWSSSGHLLMLLPDSSLFSYTILFLSELACTSSQPPLSPQWWLFVAIVLLSIISTYTIAILKDLKWALST